MGSKLTRILIIVGGTFALLFLFRLAYGYSAYPEESAAAFPRRCGQPEFNVVNYASSKIRRKGSGKQVQAALTTDQKYEKVASLAVATGDFSDDEKNLRGIIKEHNALVQYEQNTGLAGSRCLHLAIGVHPDRFDAMIAAVRRVGTLSSIQINKKDKTNEYRELNAKKESLQKTRDALLALKKRGGKIEEYMQLENRILEIEEEIQKFGVKLGEFDEENEFCTVKFTLAESSLAGISFAHRFKVALEWTIKYGLLLAFLILFAAAGAYISLVLFLKLRAELPGIWRNLTQSKGQTASE